MSEKTILLPQKIRFQEGRGPNSTILKKNLKKAEVQKAVPQKNGP